MMGTPDAERVEVVGYEGAPAGDSIASWGAAALKHAGQLLNAGSGVGVPWDEAEVDALVAEGALTRLPRPIEIEPKYAQSQLIVLELKRTPANAKALHLDVGRIGKAATSRAGDSFYVVLENETAFEQVARQLCTQILTAIVYDSPNDTDRDRLIEAGLILNSHDPGINAFRVYFSARRKAMRELATARLSERERLFFDDLLDMLLLLEASDGTGKNRKPGAGIADRAEYVLKYEKGVVPESGGLDVDAIARLATAMKTVDADLRKLLPEEYPFLNDPPPMHVHEVKAASAEFHFSTAGEVLGDRLARLIELRRLAEALEGDESVQLTDSKARNALSRIARLSDETQLRHKPIGESKVRDLSPLTLVGGQELIKSDPVSFLGYQDGLIGEARKVEVAYFPGRHMALSTSDDGDGEEPLGLSFLQTTKDFLFEPTVYTVVRAVNERGRESFFLRDVRPLKKGTSARITGIPSSVVPGAIIFGQNLLARTSDGVSINIDGVGELKASAGSLRAARSWLERYQALCLEYELKPDMLTFYLPAARPVVPSIARVIVALNALNGSAAVSAVVTEINRRFDTTVRVNNTRREVLRHPDLLSFDDDDPRTLRLSERGKLYFAAYRRAGGVEEFARATDSE